MYCAQLLARRTALVLPTSHTFRQATARSLSFSVSSFCSPATVSSPSPVPIRCWTPTITGRTPVSLQGFSSAQHATQRAYAISSIPSSSSSSGTSSSNSSSESRRRRTSRRTKSLLDDQDYRPVGEELIPMVNQLQEVLSLTGAQFSLPQLVVVGAQSSGKSSVLESLVGRDFLPRGTGVVTRRPLILQLYPTAPGSDEYAVLPPSAEEASFTSSLRTPARALDPVAEEHYEERLYDFDRVREEIARRTESLCGENSRISSVPILLKVYSPNVLPLTLVDLPGLTKMPVGDQPQDVEQQLRKMILSYAADPQSIILAVHPATQDLATSDALQLAHEADPSGDRTLGVLTKLDLMDQGTDASAILRNETVSLKLGYTAVVNRSQRAVEGKVPVRDALAAEKRFFEQNIHYAALSHHCGSTYLAQRCNRLLTDHIREQLPGLRRKVSADLRETRQKLLDIGEPVATTRAEQGWMMLQLINTFSEAFDAAIQGRNQRLTTDSLNGGARIRYLFYETFSEALSSVDPTEGLSVQELRTAIRNAAGPRPALFIPDAAFELLVKQQIERLREPSHQCLHLVEDELKRILLRVPQPELKRFHSLRQAMTEIASEVVSEQVGPAKELIDELVDIELGYINTNHPDFIGSTQGGLLSRPLSADQTHISNSASMEVSESRSSQSSAPRSTSGSGFFSRLFGASPPASADKSSSDRRSPTRIELTRPPQSLMVDEHLRELSSREQIQINLLKTLLNSYFSISSKNLQDQVIKAIWHHLVTGSKDRLHQHLVAELYKQDRFKELLQEAPHIPAQRAKLRQQLTALEQADHILSSFEMRGDFVAASRSY